MGIVKWVLGLVWGKSSIEGIIGAIGTAATDLRNAKTEAEKVDAQSRLATLQAILGDVQHARMSMKDQPWWMAAIAMMIGFPVGIHVLLIGIGTWWVAPHNWRASCSCYVQGTSWLEWTTHIPPMPEPFNTAELGVIGFFFGYGAIVVGSKAIGNAVSRRK